MLPPSLNVLSRQEFGTRWWRKGLSRHQSKTELIIISNPSTAHGVPRNSQPSPHGKCAGARLPRTENSYLLEKSDGLAFMRLSDFLNLFPSLPRYSVS